MSIIAGMNIAGDLPDLNSGVSIEKTVNQGVTSKGSNNAFNKSVALLVGGTVAMLASAPIAISIGLGVGLAVGTALCGAGMLTTMAGSVEAGVENANSEKEIIKKMETLREVQMEGFVNSIDEKYGKNELVTDSTDLSTLLMVSDSHLKKLGPKIQSQIIQIQSSLINDAFALKQDIEIITPESNEQAIEKLPELMAARDNLLGNRAVNMSMGDALMKIGNDYKNIEGGEKAGFSDNGKLTGKLYGAMAVAAGASPTLMVVSFDTFVMTVTATLLAGGFVPLTKGIDDLKDLKINNQFIDGINDRISEEQDNPGNSKFETLTSFDPEDKMRVRSSYFDAQELNNISISSSKFAVESTQGDRAKPDVKVSRDLKS